MELSKNDKDFIAFSKDIWKLAGLDELSSTILGILFINNEAVAMEDIAQITGYSLASVSNKSKILEMHEMIKRVSKPGSRKAFYYMDKNLLGIVKKNLEKNNMMNELTIKKLPDLIEGYKKENNKEKLDILEKYNENVKKVDKLIKEGISFLEKLG